MIKLIATDMDGTWLNSDKKYDVDLFEKDIALMKKNNINFVIASGNQYDNLKTRFPNNVNDLYFVAENGALVAKENQILAIEDLTIEEINEIQRACIKYKYPVVWAGLNSAYVLKSDGNELYQEMKKYYHKLQAVNSFDEIDDRLFKMSFVILHDNVLDLVTEMKEKFPKLGFVAGSEFTIDVSKVDMNKAVGLKLLGKKLGISSKEMVAFGDSGNDVAMLKYVGKSFATSTAQIVAKEAADELIGSSDDSSVQRKIIALLSK